MLKLFLCEDINCGSEIICLSGLIKMCQLFVRSPLYIWIVSRLLDNAAFLHLQLIKTARHSRGGFLYKKEREPPPTFQGLK